MWFDMWRHYKVFAFISGWPTFHVLIMASLGMPMWCRNAENGNLSPQYNSNNDNEDGSNLEEKSNGGNSVVNGNHSIKCPMFQMGVLRTNCIDCLDRTNVAQYAFGLAALGHQLNAVGVVDNPKIDLDAPLADDLMGFYERMGDTLAHQYGGSAAHNKVILTSNADVISSKIIKKCSSVGFVCFSFFVLKLSM